MTSDNQLWVGKPARTAMLLTLIASLAPLTGCGGGDSKADRLRVAGKVTYQGTPVPAGRVRFIPDKSRGGAGPAGVAKIRNGEFDTSSSKGPTAGPVKVVVTGLTDDTPGGKMIFQPYTFELDFAESDTDVLLEVPDK